MFLLSESIRFKLLSTKGVSEISCHVVACVAGGIRDRVILVLDPPFYPQACQAHKQDAYTHGIFAPYQKGIRER